MKDRKASRRNCKNCGNCQICCADGIPDPARRSSTGRAPLLAAAPDAYWVIGTRPHLARRFEAAAVLSCPRATLHAFSATARTSPCARPRREGGVAHRLLGSIERRRVAALRFRAVLSRAVLFTGRRSVRPCTISAIGSTAARRARRECQRSAARVGVSHLALSLRVGACIGTPSDGLPRPSYRPAASPAIRPATQRR